MIGVEIKGENNYEIKKMHYNYYSSYWCNCFVNRFTRGGLLRLVHINKSLQMNIMIKS